MAFAATQPVDQLDEKDLRLYRTPAWVVEAILPHLLCCNADGEVLAGTRVLEPCAGDGAICDVLEARMDLAVVVAVEPVARRFEGAYETTAQEFARRSRDERQFDLIITNPPFGPSCDIWEAVLPLLKAGGQIAFLNRLSWASSGRRVEFWRRYPSDVYVLPKRPSFVASGAVDTWDYAWFVHTKNCRRPPTWQVLDCEVA